VELSTVEMYLLAANSLEESVLYKQTYGGSCKDTIVGSKSIVLILSFTALSISSNIFALQL
jgi:hypothetical protein